MTAPLAFITGASSGIGQALAAAYAARGHRLALVARRQALLHEWADRQGLSEDRCLVLGADVTEAAGLAAAAGRCLEHFGLPDVVVANAGISHGVDTALAEDLPVMRRILETNLLGMAATFQPFIAPMRERRHGTLVGIASVAGVRGLPGHGAYCASKAGAIAYCESLRGECRAFGVKVVTLLPGYVDTPLTQGDRHTKPFLLPPEAFAARALRAIDAGRRSAVIPWPMAIAAHVLRWLPDAAFDRLLADRPRKPRAPEAASP